MKKGAVITFNNADNFGAMLQCFALKKYLTSCCINTIVADSGDKAVSDFYKIFRFSNHPFVLWNQLKHVSKKLKRRKAFNSFRKKYIKATDKYHDCDLYFCGSDQIWNFDITKGYNPFYFANFNRPANSKVVSYAASIGKSTLTDFELDRIGNELTHFYKISVREEKAKEVLSALTEKKIDILPDPTLLIQRTEWGKMAVVPKQGTKEYVLFYCLCNSPLARSIALDVSRMLNVELIEIRGDCNPEKTGDHIVFDAIGPCEFLGFINNARFVVTDSFHGTVFSNIFHKDFYSVSPKGLGARMQTLLKYLNHEDRLVDSWNGMDFVQPVDHSETDLRIDELRIAAHSFISSLCEDEI